MEQTLNYKIGQRLLLAFQGKDQLPPEFKEALHNLRPSGVTLFRSFNVDNPVQVLRLTDFNSTKSKASRIAAHVNQC